MHYADVSYCAGSTPVMLRNIKVLYIDSYKKRCVFSFY